LAIPPELLKLWVDGGFNGPEFAAWVQTQHPKLMVEVVARPTEVLGFHVLLKRWVIERTFGWLTVNDIYFSSLTTTIIPHRT